MKKHEIVTLVFALVLLCSCSKEKDGDTTLSDGVKQKFQKISDKLTEAEKKDDLASFLKHYDENAFSLPEYQPVLDGINEIEIFYEEIFQRQKIKTFQRKVEEVIDLGKTVIEIGSFTKEYTDSETDSFLTQNGKYWNIWEVKSEGNYKLKGECFGFFHPVKNPGALVVPLKTLKSGESDLLDHEIPLELRAYNALDENYVRRRAGALKSDFYTNDAKFMPFANPTVTGIQELKPYFIEYSSRGKVTIDSISVRTFYYEYFDDYVMEYAKFKVKWSASTYSGRTEGKGIRLWKRQKDKSLKAFRHIGTHNHLEFKL